MTYILNLRVPEYSSINFSIFLCTWYFVFLSVEFSVEYPTSCKKQYISNILSAFEDYKGWLFVYRIYVFALYASFPI